MRCQTLDAPFFVFHRFSISGVKALEFQVCHVYWRLPFAECRSLGEQGMVSVEFAPSGKELQ